MVYFLKIISGLLIFTLLATANPDPLDILRGDSPNRKKRVEKKRITKKKKRIIKKKRKTVTKKRRKKVKKKIKYSKREYIKYSRRQGILSKPINYKIYSKHKLTGKPYLDMKAIDGPMPEDYFALFVKSKSLKNPVKTNIKIIIDKSAQRMYVYRDFQHLYTLKVSTGKAGYTTPNGVFKPYSVERMHFSKKYFNAPMPWSVFFNNGIAIHATDSIGKLGTPASHGCVRTYPKSAKRIYNLVRKYGRRNTTIIVRN